MNFLFPAFLVGALAVAVPIALHFLRRDVAVTIPFTAVRLLPRSPVQRAARRRLTDLLLLAARVAALLLLAFAFARPYFAGAATAGAPLTIVAVDRSYSMGTPELTDRSHALARDAVDGVASGGVVALVAFDDRAEVIAPAGSASAARTAIDGIRPGAGGTNYAALLATAGDLAGNHAARVIVITDLQRGGWGEGQRAVLPAGVGVEVRDAGSGSRNAAVAAVTLQPDRVVASVRADAVERTGQLRVLVDGREVAAARFGADAGVTTDVPVLFKAPSSGVLAIEIDDPGGLPADNRRFVSLDPGQRPSLLLVTGGGGDSAFFLSRALEAAAEPVTALDLQEVNGTRVGELGSEHLARFAGAVLLSTRSLDRPAREALNSMLRRGAGIVVIAGPDVDPTVVSGTFDLQPALRGVEETERAGTLAATDLRHPIFRPFGPLTANLGQVRFTRAWRLPADGWDVAARFADASPALLERRVGEGRMVLFASDVARRWNDFPLHPSFVPFVSEVVRYAALGRNRPQEYVVGATPPGTAAGPGVHTIDGRRVAVNVDPREGSLVRMTAEEFDAMIERVAAPDSAAALHVQEAEASQGLWRYGLLLMLVALVAESLVGRV